MKLDIMLLPGDGVGPEVVAQTVRVVNHIGEKYGHAVSYESGLIGGCSIDQNGNSLTDETIEKCKRSGAVLLGAVGGPKWDDPSAKDRPERGLLKLRKEMGVFANLRPVRVHPSLVDASPLKPEKLAGVDMLVIRELTGGLYFGQPRGRDVVDGKERAIDTLEYYDFEIRRVTEMAFKLAQNRRKKVTSVDKANVLESSRLWRKIAIEVGQNYQDVALDHVLVDTAAMRLVSNPAGFDVIVTENMFGDILTDEASVLAGSMGMLPSASLGSDGPGVYEPIHGSAPDIAGKGIANPTGTILSGAMMLRYSFGLEAEAASIEKAADLAITDGCRTVDLGGSLSTIQMADEIIKRI